jgi:predicted dehydrogenase|tara:strand:+ start:623 stop:1618 length:996 start_codon:yes stop_codon:yes gene_type:complete
MKQCLKILVVGYGSIGKRHVNNLLLISNIEVIICTHRNDIDSELKSKCKIFESLNDCLNEKPVAAIISNVTSLHIQTALKLASAGLHLFIEKPLSHNLENIQKLSNIVHEKKLITFMGFNLRFHNCIKKIKELLENNEIGKIISVYSESGSYLPDWHPNENYRDSYASKENLGGGVVLTCIHEIDYLHWFFGEVKELFAITGKFSDLKIEVDDLASIIMRFSNNIIAELHLDFFQKPDFRCCKIIGTNGTIYWDSVDNIVKLYDVKLKKWIEKISIINYQRNDMYVDEIKYFLDCISKNENTNNDIDGGISTLNIALDIIESSKSKRLVFH